MKTCRGQSLTEYGLILGLVVVICIAGMSVFGKNISAALANMTGGQGSGATAQTTATSTPPPLVASVDTTSASTPAAQAPAPRPTMSAKFDPKTGQIVFQTSDGGTSGKTTTGDQGTEAIAQALAYLAQTATKDDGTPADPEVTNMITQLGDMYHKIAGAETQINGMPTTADANAAYEATGIKPMMDTLASLYKGGSVTSANQQLGATSTPQSITAYMAAHPEYSKVFQQVQDLSGVGSSIMVMNYMMAHTPAAQSMTTAQIADCCLYGTDLTSHPVSVELSPPTTHTAATGLQQTGQQVGNNMP